MSEGTLIVVSTFALAMLAGFLVGVVAGRRRKRGDS